MVTRVLASPEPAAAWRAQVGQYGAAAEPPHRVQARIVRRQARASLLRCTHPPTPPACGGGRRRPVRSNFNRCQPERRFITTHACTPPHRTALPKARRTITRLIREATNSCCLTDIGLQPFSYIKMWFVNAPQVVHSSRHQSPGQRRVAEGRALAAGTRRCRGLENTHGSDVHATTFSHSRRHWSGSHDRSLHRRRIRCDPRS